LREKETDVKGPWTVESQAQFAASFGRTNYRFRYFDLVLESGGDPIDVAFNYKDLAHLKVVHNTFDIFYSHISDDIQSCVVMQKLFGLNFPLTHIALQLDENRLFFHDSFLNILMTSEVTTEALPEHRVKVRTTYGVGAPRLLLPLVYPVLKRMLTRNFHILMEGDAPMRNRRGDLRRWGLRLPKTSYSFQETFDVRARNVLADKTVQVPEPISIPFASVPMHGPVLFGRSDHYGLQIFRQDGAIEVFPRMCPHEGACLDRNSLNGQPSISCGWHGRRFAPIVKISLPAQPAEFAGHFHRLIVSCDELRIVPIPTSDETGHADWTAPVVSHSIS
jgi:hypothetical protein